MTKPRSILTLILSGYLLLTVAYGVVNPLYEGPDEYYHYFTVQYIADTSTLPIAQTPETADYIEQEAAQPPLYYWLGSWLIRSIDTSDARDALWLNPRVQMGDASAASNLNRAVHDPAVEAFPWSGHVLANHVLRLFSTLFGFGTLLVLYATVRLIWPAQQQRAMLAIALVAFLPQFNFLHSYVNNDVAIIFFASLTLFLLVRVWNSAESPPSIQQLVLIGITVGLAMLSKTAGLLLLVYATGFIFFTTLLHRRLLAQAVGHATVTGLSALSIAGWLLWRNWQLYGDISAANQFVEIAGGDEGFTLLEIFGQTSGIWRSLLAVFGWFNIVPPMPVYWLWSGLILIALLGAGLGLRRERPSLFGLLLSGWLAIVYAGMVAFMLRTPAAQGRLLLPAILPLVLPLAFGLSYWQRRMRATALMLVALPLLSAYCLFFVIQPAYTRPPLVETVPPAATVLDATLVDNLTLKAANLWITPYFAGDNVPVDLYWESTGPIDEAHEIVVELFGRNNTPIGKLQTYHGGGLYPTNLWLSDDSLHSSIGVRLDEQIEVPTQARVNVRVVGAGDGVDIGYVEIEPAAWPVLDQAVQPIAIIGDEIELISAELSQLSARAGTIVSVDVVWRVINAPNKHLTTLVHLGPAEQPPLSAADSVPLNGDYPTTFWQAEEIIRDSYKIALPQNMAPGEYPVRIGMYDKAIVRVPLATAGELTPDFTYTVATITVTQP